ASRISCFARSILRSYSGHSIAYCTSLLIQLPVGLPSPPASAWLMARRSMARLTASRTRLSRTGFLGSWTPGNSSHPHPESTGAIGGPEENREVEEGFFEEEADCAVVDDLDALRLLLEDVGLGTPVVLVAELDILRSDRFAVVEPDPPSQRERGAPRICGDRE